MLIFSLFKKSDISMRTEKLLITANSVVNILTPVIFTSDAQIMFFPIVILLSTVNQPVGIEQCLDSDLPDLFLCFFLPFLFAIFMKLHSAICT